MGLLSKSYPGWKLILVFWVVVVIRLFITRRIF